MRMRKVFRYTEVDLTEEEERLAILSRLGQSSYMGIPDRYRVGATVRVNSPDRHSHIGPGRIGIVNKGRDCDGDYEIAFLQTNKTEAGSTDPDGWSVDVLYFEEGDLDPVSDPGEPVERPANETPRRGRKLMVGAD